MKLGVGDYAQATFEFQGEAPGDLSLDIGDVVRITDSIDENWLSGEKVGNDVPQVSGSFPAAFVKHLSLPSVRTGQKIFLAVEDFLAEQIGDLELAKGDIVIGTEAVDESWWRGKNGPLKGIFPLSFVSELSHDDGIRSRSYSARANSLKSRSGSLASRSSSIGAYEGIGVSGGISFDAGVTKVTEPTFARALVDVSPQLDGELAFQLGDLIEITEIIDGDWFFGRCRNKEGLVSAVCVELLEEEEEDGGGVHSAGNSDVSRETSHQLPIPPHEGSGSYGGDDPRLRNTSSASYTSENTRSHDAEIAPYARVMYSFSAQTRSELDLQEGEIVTLISHLDGDWMEGELDGRRGIFPTSFVDIVVDCPHAADSILMHMKDRGAGSEQRSDRSDPASTMPATSMIGSSIMGGPSADHDTSIDTTSLGSYDHPHSPANLANSRAGNEHPVGDWSEDASKEPAATKEGTSVAEQTITAGISEVLEISADTEIGLVLHTFEAQMDGDVSVREGDTVEVVRQLDDNWLEVRTDASRTGLVPRNHVEVIGLWTKEEQGGSSSKNESKVVTKSPPPQRPPPLSQSGRAWRTTNTDHSLGDKPTGLASTSSSVSSNQRSLSLDPASDSVSSSHLGAGRSTKEGNAHREAGVAAAAVAKYEERLKLNSSVNYAKPIMCPSGGMSQGNAPALPGKRPSPYPKPALAPKPNLKPRPVLTTPSHPAASAARAPMERSTSLNSPKPVRPPALMTAKPFSSLPRVKPHHVMSPMERRLSLSGLDSIIEGEMEKAKSRSSSQNSDSGREQGSSVETGVVAQSENQLEAAAAAPTGKTAGSGATNSTAELTVTSNLDSQAMNQPFQNPASLTSAQASMGRQGSQDTLSHSCHTSKDQLCFEDNFSGGGSDSQAVMVPTTRSSNTSSHGTTSHPTTSGRAPLTTSISVSERRRQSNSNPDTSQRRKSASHAEHTNGRLSKVAHESGESSFINKAFVMEVDEGKLVDLGGPDRSDLSSSHAPPAHEPPKRTAPSRPASAIINTPLTSKLKAAPARPTGPCVAPAPSKVPLVPNKAEPLTAPPKLVPKRPAPKAPGTAPRLPQPTAVNNSNSSNNNNPKNNNDIEPGLTATAAQTVSGQARSRPAPHPPERQAPRPASLATPPHRAPPPRPTDLITFSPDEKEASCDPDISEETTKAMVKDIKLKLAENRADYKLHRSRM